MRFLVTSYPTFPLSAIPLQTFNIEADFDYSKIQKARKLSYMLRTLDSVSSSAHVSAGEIAAIGVMGKIYY
ncbi:MAG: hypothetical protein KGY46_10290, partial [Anaerolineales bacterium]|nr:hypothetical protein [Anaerolineales bacterium]